MVAEAWCSSILNTAYNFHHNCPSFHRYCDKALQPPPPPLLSRAPIIVVLIQNVKIHVRAVKFMSFISMNLQQINEGLFFKAFFCVMHKLFNQLQFGLLFTVYSFFKLTKKSVGLQDTTIEQVAVLNSCCTATQDFFSGLEPLKFNWCTFLLISKMSFFVSGCFKNSCGFVTLFDYEERSHELRLPHRRCRVSGDQRECKAAFPRWYTAICCLARYHHACTLWSKRV